jgi:hypothetical protein
MSGNVFAVGRMLFSALLAAGGIAAIWFGYRLFLQGAGLHRGVDKFDLKSDWGKISFAGMSVGGLLMLTAGGLGQPCVSFHSETRAGVRRITHNRHVQIPARPGRCSSLA